MAAALLFLGIPFGIHAGEPRYGDMVLTDDKEHPADRHEYTPDTPTIFLLTTTVEVPEGSRLEAVWIAAKTEVAPPDYEIDRAELTGGGDMNQVTFSLSRPDAGWPAGEYRVELLIGGQPAGSVGFTVTP